MSEPEDSIDNERRINLRIYNAMVAVAQSSVALQIWCDIARTDASVADKVHAAALSLQTSERLLNFWTARRGKMQQYIYETANTTEGTNA